jgi:hypothetical protein
MKNFNLCLTLIAVVMLVGLTNCKKTDVNPTANYVGTVNGSFIAQDASIKINKDLAPNQLVTRNWIMYAVNSPFYPANEQPFALVKGLEFIQGSAADIWWNTSGNNPVSFAASQAVYSNLTPAEPVRLIMEGYGPDNTKPAYLGILDFNPTAAQFPLAVVSKSLGDVLIVNADGLTKLPGGNLISVAVTYNAFPVDIQATEKKLTLSSGLNEGLATGVTGALDFSDILYGQPNTIINVPVTSGDCIVFSDFASKIKGNITITITFASSPSAPGVNTNVITLPAIQAALAGNGMKLVLTTTKLGWYDSTTIGVTDSDIQVQLVTVPVN